MNANFFKSFLFTLVFFCSLILSNCGGGGGSDNNATTPVSTNTNLIVNVTNSNGTKLANVKGTLSPYNIIQYSDNNGIITFSNVQEGNYSVKLEFSGYYDTTTVMTVLTSNYTFNVIMQQLQPKLGTSVNTLEFDYQMRTKTLTLSNTTQTGTVNWSLTSDKSWLTSNTTSGNIATTQTTNLTITVDTSTLSYGTHLGNLTLTSNGGNTVVAVIVDVPKTNSSWLTSQSDSITFDFNDVQKTVVIKNVGMFSTAWSVSSKPSWLTASETNGTLAFNNSRTITLNADRSALSTGTQTGNIIFAGSANNCQVPLTIKVSSNVASTLSSSSVSYTSAILSWTTSAADGFSNYKLYRSTTTGVNEYSTLVTTITNKNTLSYTDANLSQNQTYYYALYTNLGDGRNSKSSEITITTPSSTPAQFYTYSFPISMTYLFAFDALSNNAAFAAKYNVDNTNDRVFDSNDGYYYYYPKIYRFNGSTWSSIISARFRTDYLSTYFAYDLSAANENVGFVAGIFDNSGSYGGYKYNLTTNTINFIRYSTETIGYYSVYAISENEAWFGGNNAFYRYYNGTVTKNSLSGVGNIYDLKFKNGIGYAVSTSGQLLVNNGGSWAILATRVTGAEGGANFYALDVVASNKIWILGNQTWGSKIKRFFYYDGSTIEIVDISGGNDNFSTVSRALSQTGYDDGLDISFVNENLGWAISKQGIYKYSNGTWSSVTNPLGTGSSAYLFRLKALGTSSVWINSSYNAVTLNYK